MRGALVVGQDAGRRRTVARVLTFEPWHRSQTGELVGFLCGEPWPFHARARPEPAAVRSLVDAGHYDGAGIRTSWILDDGARIGLVRVYDLEDDTAMFDLRLTAARRGQGIGTATVRWLTGQVFTDLAHVHRVEATTRQDNRAMRAALRRAGYVKEAHHRDGWPVPGGPPLDAVGYAVLRRDWEAGTTTPPAWDDEPAPDRT